MGPQRTVRWVHSSGKEPLRTWRNSYSCYFAKEIQFVDAHPTPTPPKHDTGGQSRLPRRKTMNRPKLPKSTLRTGPVLAPRTHKLAFILPHIPHSRRAVFAACCEHHTARMPRCRKAKLICPPPRFAISSPLSPCSTATDLSSRTAATVFPHACPVT